MIKDAIPKHVLREGFHRSYHRKGVYPVQDILSQLPRKFIWLDGDGVVLSNARIRTFQQSLECCRCGLVGSFFAKERAARKRKIRNPDTNRYDTIYEAVDEGFHLNLYAINRHGHEILMTKDHIIPKSKGGPDHMSNYRTMCSPCNQKRGNKDDPSVQPSLHAGN